MQVFFYQCIRVFGEGWFVSAEAVRDLLPSAFETLSIEAEGLIREVEELLYRKHEKHKPKDTKLQFQGSQSLH